MRYRLRALALAALVLSGALLLTACGGSKKASSTASAGGGDATSLLKDTFSSGHSIKSAHLVMSLAATLHGVSSIPGPVGLKISGPFDHLDATAPPKFDLDLTGSFGGQSFNAGVVSDGSTFAVKIKNAAYALPDAFTARLKQAYSQGGSTTTPKTSLSSLGIQPLKLIKNASVVGDQDIGGDPTTHIKAEVDPNGLIDTVNAVLAKAGSLGVPQTSALPKSVPSNVRSQIVSALKNASIDVFTGKTDHTLRELDITLAVTPPAGSAGSLTEADLKVQVQFTNVNKPQSVTVPANTKPFSQLQQQLGGLLGGLGGLGGGAGLGATGSSGSGTSTGTPAAPAAGSSAAKTQQKLQACILKAAGDTAALNKCLSLVGSG